MDKEQLNKLDYKTIKNMYKVLFHQTQKDYLETFWSLYPKTKDKKVVAEYLPKFKDYMIDMIYDEMQYQTYNEIVYYPMNVLMSSNERIINAMYEHMVSIKYKNDAKKKILRTKEIEVDV